MTDENYNYCTNCRNKDFDGGIPVCISFKDGGRTQIKNDCKKKREYDRLRNYENTGLTPEEILDQAEMFRAYRHVCGGKSPEEVESLLNKNTRNETCICKHITTGNGGGDSVTWWHVCTLDDSPTDFNRCEKCEKFEQKETCTLFDLLDIFVDRLKKKGVEGEDLAKYLNQLAAGLK